MVAVDLVAEEHLVIGSKNVLSAEQIQKITQAVVKAEKGTKGEIVPMIVSRSSVIGHLPFYITFILFSLVTIALLESSVVWIRLWWGLPLAGVFLVCSVFGFILSRVSVVQRWLIPAIDEDTQVWNRAHSEWAFSRIQRTKERTGILLYVSMMERKAIVLADEGIAKHYPPNTWQEVIDLLTMHLRQGEWTEGFEKAIQRCGEILKTHLPATDNDTNEISDRLIIKN